jgi:hypothetical protein
MSLSRIGSCAITFNQLSEVFANFSGHVTSFKAAMEQWAMGTNGSMGPNGSMKLGGQQDVGGRAGGWACR